MRFVRRYTMVGDDVIHGRETPRAGVLVGNSMGAQTAVEVAIRSPELVPRLVLLGPTIDASARGFVQQLGRLLADAVRERPSLVALTLTDTALTRRRAVYRYLRAAFDHHVQQRLPLVTAPVVVVRGSRDPLVPRRWARALAAAARQGCVVEVPGAAHACHHGRPDAVARLLLSVAARHPGAC